MNRKRKELKKSVIPVYNAFIHWEAKINKKRMPDVRHSFIFKYSFLLLSQIGFQ